MPLSVMKTNLAAKEDASGKPEVSWRRRGCKPAEASTDQRPEVLVAHNGCPWWL
jgi:hypothetical protein